MGLDVSRKACSVEGVRRKACSVEVVIAYSDISCYAVGQINKSHNYQCSYKISRTLIFMQLQ